MLPVKKILCPTDFSEPSYEALDAAKELAKHFDAELIITHVLAPLPVYPASMAGASAPINPPITLEMEEHVEKSLMIIMQEKIPREVNAHSVLLKGNAPDEIVKHAEKEDADIIVIGTHGLTGWRHLIFGSVAEKVVRLAGCPVLTIPALPEEDE